MQFLPVSKFDIVYQIYVRLIRFNEAVVQLHYHHAGYYHVSPSQIVYFFVCKSNLPNLLMYLGKLDGKFVLNPVLPSVQNPKIAQFFLIMKPYSIYLLCSVKSCVK